MPWGTRRPSGRIARLERGRSHPRAIPRPARLASLLELRRDAIAAQRCPSLPVGASRLAFREDRALADSLALVRQPAEPVAKPHDAWKRIVGREPVQLLDAANRPHPFREAELMSPDGTDGVNDIVFKQPLPARLERGRRRFLARELEVARADHVHVIRSGKEPEDCADPHVHIEHLVQAVAPVEAIANSDTAAIPNSFHEAPRLGCNDVVGQTDREERDPRGRALSQLLAREDHGTIRVGPEVTVTHPHAVGVTRDVLLKDNVQRLLAGLSRTELMYELLAGVEIGRASCRERVEMSVVAG